MQVKSLTFTFPQLPEMTWPKEAFRRAIELIENTYHRIFGCWHTDMSRPFTIDQQTYRMCLNCGAHRAFDTEQWKMIGPYYVRRPSTKAIYRPALTPVRLPAPTVTITEQTPANRRNLRRAA